jgi:hypothetical protein
MTTDARYQVVESCYGCGNRIASGTSCGAYLGRARIPPRGIPKWCHLPKVADMVSRADVDRLASALDGLLDGLNANNAPRDGLTNEEWDKRISKADAALDALEK